MRALVFVCVCVWNSINIRLVGHCLWANKTRRGLYPAPGIARSRDLSQKSIINARLWLLASLY